MSFCDAKIRCTDEAEIESTIPSRINVLASSTQVQVDSDRPISSGNSHASLTAYVATIGGKKRGPPASWCVGKAAESVLCEPCGPFPHDASCQPDLAADRGQGHTIGDHQDHLCSNDVAMWHDQGAGDFLQQDPLIVLQDDLNRQ